MTTEETLYQDGSVTVTNARAVFGSTTYPIRNITSVSVTMVPGHRNPGLATAAFGLVFVTISAAGSSFDAETLRAPGFYVGLAFLALGALWAVKARPTYAVMLKTAGDEHRAVTDTDFARISKIGHALNDACAR